MARNMNSGGKRRLFIIAIACLITTLAGVGLGAAIVGPIREWRARDFALDYLNALAQGNAEMALRMRNGVGDDTCPLLWTNDMYAGISERPQDPHIQDLDVTSDPVTGDRIAVITYSVTHDRSSAPAERHWGQMILTLVGMSWQISATADIDTRSGIYVPADVTTPDRARFPSIKDPVARVIVNSGLTEFGGCQVTDGDVLTVPPGKYDIRYTPRGGEVADLLPDVVAELDRQVPGYPRSYPLPATQTVIPSLVAADVEACAESGFIGELCPGELIATLSTLDLLAPPILVEREVAPAPSRDDTDAELIGSTGWTQPDPSNHPGWLVHIARRPTSFEGWYIEVSVPYNVLVTTPDGTKVIHMTYTGLPVREKVDGPVSFAKALS